MVKLPTVPGFSEEAELMANKVLRIHQEVTAHLEKADLKYKVHADAKKRFKEYAEGDLVMIFLRKNRFPAGQYNKLQNKKIDPYRILKKISPNAYVIDLPADLRISPTFNIADISNYHPPDEFELQ